MTNHVTHILQSADDFASGKTTFEEFYSDFNHSYFSDMKDHAFSDAEKWLFNIVNDILHDTGEDSTEYGFYTVDQARQAVKDLISEYNLNPREWYETKMPQHDEAVEKTRLEIGEERIEKRVENFKNASRVTHITNSVMHEIHRTTIRPR
jgi:hypothetical protein